jgi:hypothetical protein
VQLQRGAATHLGTAGPTHVRRRRTSARAVLLGARAGVPPPHLTAPIPSHRHVSTSGLPRHRPSVRSSLRLFPPSLVVQGGAVAVTHGGCNLAVHSPCTSSACRSICLHAACSAVPQLQQHTLASKAAATACFGCAWTRHPMTNPRRWNGVGRGMAQHLLAADAAGGVRGLCAYVGGVIGRGAERAAQLPGGTAVTTAAAVLITAALMHQRSARSSHRQRCGVSAQLTAQPRTTRASSSGALHKHVVASAAHGGGLHARRLCAGGTAGGGE